MADPAPTCSFQRLTDPPSGSPTLIEGFPGLGLVASIVVDQITEQLKLDHHGTIVSDDFPPIVSFEDGRARDPIRVYAGAEPPVMTLHSDMPMPPSTFPALTRCITDQLADEFSRAIFLVGAPAGSEDEIGQIRGIATDETVRSELLEADIELAKGPGLIGGVTGALIRTCHRKEIPAGALVVASNPYMPDLVAARAVIEDGLEPLVDFDIDTSRLEEQAEQIEARKRQIAEQLRQAEEQGPSTIGDPSQAMYR